MEPISTAAQVRWMDREMIDGLGLPGIALMELASAAVARCVRERFAAEAARGVVVAAGPGNNGGDGWGCARWLAGWGLPVSVWAPLGPPTRGDARIEADVSRRSGVAVRATLGDAGLIVDALFGTGLDRPLDGAARDAVLAVRDHGAAVVAVDLPSGVSTDTGAAVTGVDARGPIAVRAAATVTFGRLKPGVLLGHGGVAAGVVVRVDLGLDGIGGPVAAWFPSAVDVASAWPRRAVDAHKGRSGRLLIVAGSPEMAGAAALVCRGALAGGAGLVTLVSPRGLGARIAALPDAVMWGGTDLPDATRFDAVVVGPGLGGGRPLDPAWGAWIDTIRAPTVVDADALGAAANRPGRVLTPHVGEAARRLGQSVAEVEADPIAAARRLSAGGATALLKGWRTVVAGPATARADEVEGGGWVSINPTGSPVLATGGSGDVLAGVVGALLARGVPTTTAAWLGAWVHGRAGERLAAERVEGWSARDLADAIAPAIP